MKTKGGKDSKDDVKLTSFSTEDAGKNNMESINYAQKHDVEREAGNGHGNDVVGLPAANENQLRGNGSNNEATEAAGNTPQSTTQSLLAFCSNVSIAGVRYVANTSSSSYRRSVWALLVLAGVVFTAYQIQDRIRYYYSRPVNVIIRDEHVHEMRFPTVTICSENRVSLSKMSALGKCWSVTGAANLGRTSFRRGNLHM